jgi:hypothetical protein
MIYAFDAATGKLTPAKNPFAATRTGFRAAAFYFFIQIINTLI